MRSRCSNPNRMRALIGGFSANATQFNRADGAGYDFLCEVVLTLDPTNPQVAARLLTALRSWRSLEAGRQAKAEAVLRRIVAQPSLSDRRARHRHPLARLKRCAPRLTPIFRQGPTAPGNPRRIPHSMRRGIRFWASESAPEPARKNSLSTIH